MKKLILLPVLFVSLLSVSCSDDDNKTPENPGAPVSSQVVAATGFNYKEFYLEEALPENRKGIVILAVGDGADENDGTLNDQCVALAQNGYVAITTDFVELSDATLTQINQKFQANIEEVILKTTTTHAIPRSKVIIGGLSRGGNNVFALVLPGQMGVDPIVGIKAVILQCSGGDNWKGSAIKYPVAYMSTLNDNEMNSNANEFKAGLQANMNPGVADSSECLIIPGTGHCTELSRYKPFIVQKVVQWLP